MPTSSRNGKSSPTFSEVFNQEDIVELGFAAAGTSGVFLVVAYASGHAIAALGNLLEAIWWGLWGGMPTDWVIYNRDWILSTAQKQALLTSCHWRP